MFLRNPFRKLFEAARRTGQQVVESVVAAAMAIGVPASWFTFGWPPKADWLKVEQIYREFPMVSYGIEQLAEQAIGPGYYLQPGNPEKAKEVGQVVDDLDPSERAMQICQNFDRKVHAKDRMLRAARELALYGNHPMERRFTVIKKDPEDAYTLQRNRQGDVTGLGDFVTIQPLPISTMRVVPDTRTGVDPPKGYIQIIMGNYNKFAPEQIAWFKVNVTGGQVGNDFYGMGLIQPTAAYVWGLRKMEEYMIRIMKRYAAPKTFWRVGTDAKPAKPGDVDSWAETIKDVEPDEDIVGLWTVDAKTLEPDLRARFEEYVTHFRSMIIVGLQNPNLILAMSAGRVSDASATKMGESWDRKVQVVQENIKELWQDLFYKPLIIQAGIDPEFTPEIIYGQPETEDPTQEMKDLVGLLSNTLQLTNRTRLDIENILRAKYGLEEIDVEQELLAQKTAEAVQNEALTKQANARAEISQKMTEYLQRRDSYLKESDLEKKPSSSALRRN